MQPNKRQKPMQEVGLYDSVDLSRTEDQELKRMKSALVQLFDSAHSGANTHGQYARERAMIVVGAATGYAAICTEQRERAMLRAHQKHFKKK